MFRAGLHGVIFGCVIFGWAVLFWLRSGWTVLVLCCVALRYGVFRRVAPRRFFCMFVFFLTCIRKVRVALPGVRPPHSAPRRVLGVHLSLRC